MLEAMTQRMAQLEEQRAAEVKIAADNELRYQTRMAQLEQISENLARQIAPLQEDPLAGFE
jgi:biopolymer transport protein ExbD